MVGSVVFFPPFITIMPKPSVGVWSALSSPHTLMLFTESYITECMLTFVACSRACATFVGIASASCCSSVPLTACLPVHPAVSRATAQLIIQILFFISFSDLDCKITKKKSFFLHLMRPR